MTLVGPGGVGKTRLALELARRQVLRRADGVWLVDLAVCPEAADVASETARVLDVRVRVGGLAPDLLGAYLANRNLLVVLDNCEHVVEACARLSAALLSSSASVRILATSREVLDVPGERVGRLQPLEPASARRLFVERARERGAELPPGSGDDEAVDRLCQRLDRLPLAIELAAARVGVMSVEEILDGVESQLGGLGGGRLALPRHRTLRATVEWSHRLLDPGEQAVLRQLSVFAGGFEADAAVAVAAGLSIDVLGRLVEKSLVSVVKSPRGRTRYRLLETVREFEHELLVEAGESDAARERHLRHFLARAQLERDGWPSLSAQPVVEDLQADYENVRGALDWAVVTDPCAGMTLFNRTWELFQVFGQADGLRLGELLLERCPAQDRTRALVQISVGSLRMMQADMEGASAAQEQARRLSRRLGDSALEGWARLFQGLAATLGGAAEPGRNALTEARDLLREAGVRNGEGKAIAALGLIELSRGDPARAEELVQAALSIQIGAGDVWSQGQCHTYLGMICEANSDFARATSHYRQAIDALRPFRDTTLLPSALALQGGVLGRRDPRRALTVLAAAYSIRARGGGEFAPVFRELIERARSAAEAALGAGVEAVWGAGARLRSDEAIALAFGTAAPRRASRAGLSERELEVARLVGDGLSNKAIAARLHLSARTVESHVRHALAKLGIENRIQLATWARERIQ